MTGMFFVLFPLLVFFSLYWLGTMDVEAHGSHISQAAVAAAAGPLVNAGADVTHGD